MFDKNTDGMVEKGKDACRTGNDWIRLGSRCRSIWIWAQTSKIRVAVNKIYVSTVQIKEMIEENM